MVKYIVIIMLLLICAGLFVFNLGDLSLLKGDENYYFSSARRMIREGDWITPRYHHHVRFEKPILYYWIVALFFKLFGVSWFSARLSSALFGTLTVIITYLLGLRLLQCKTAFLASLILATSFAFFLYSRLAVIDMTFLFLITLSFYLVIKGEQDKRWSYIIFASLPLGLSVMAKGPLGVAIFFLTVFTYAILGGRLYLLNPLSLFLGLIIILAISLPWPYLMYRIHGAEYLNHILETEAVDKTVGSILKLNEIENLPLFILRYLGYYVPVVLFFFLPWSLFLPFGLFKRLRVNGSGDAAFILSWFWVTFLFFSIVSFKHTHYILLLSPPLAMIVANFFSERLKTAIALAAAAFMVYVSTAGFVMPALEEDALKTFSLALAPQIKPDEEIGIASRNFNLKKLGIHLNNLVSTPYELSGDDLAQYRDLVTAGKLVPFLKSEKRFFLLITKNDYEKRVPEEQKSGLYILEQSLVWKRLKIERDLPSILRLEFGELKEKAYLVSNKGG